LPRAYFVGNITIGRTESDIFRELNSLSFNPATTAILENQLPKEIFEPDSTATVTITDYKSRNIAIRTSNTVQSLLVLSEVYYPAGWRAYIDGVETEIHKTNYILRSIVVPAGAHDVVFKFEPMFYELGWTLSNTAWGVSILCVGIGLWQIPSVRSRIGRKPREQDVP
jgi:uncharacterized membrane protein YfhO